MSSEPKVRVEIDIQQDTAYVTLSRSEIVKTAEYSDSILVDLDEHGVAVGIEILGTGTKLPLSDLERQFHIHSSVAPILGHLLPSIETRIQAQAAPDSVTESRSTRELAEH